MAVEAKTLLYRNEAETKVATGVEFVVNLLRGRAEPMSDKSEVDCPFVPIKVWHNDFL